MKRLLLAILFLLAQAAHAEEAAPPPQVMAMLHLPPPHYRADGNYGGAYRTDPARQARRAVALELAKRYHLTLVADWPMPVLGVDCYVFTLGPGDDPARVVAALAADQRVEWAQPVTQFRTLGAGDPLYLVQPTAAQWHLADLHRIATGRKTTVAVVDSGVDDTHPELAGQVSARENFVDGQPYAAEPHGTAVAGIIAAHADNGIGIRGVAPDARILALRACDERHGPAHCDSFSLAKALNFAILHKPDVINLSLTGPPDRLLQRLVDTALARGVRVVGAADPQLADGGFPASWPGVLAVSDRKGKAMQAPGRDVPAPLPGGRFGVLSGASYAAAQVSGLLALMGELRPGAALAVRAGEPVDACGALGQVAPGCVCGCPLAVSAAGSPGAHAR